MEAYFLRLEGKDQVRVVCMDLAADYRSLVRCSFPNAVIVADRFHVIRLVNHHFLACWREIDDWVQEPRPDLPDAPTPPQPQTRAGAPAAGLSGRTPGPGVIYRFKQRLCYLLLKKHQTRKECQKLIPRFLRAILELRQSGLAQLVQLGETLHSWSEEIDAMWRFTRSNGITEGFHNKMETISRQAYGFRNFENYRQRVQVFCA